MKYTLAALIAAFSITGTHATTIVSTAFNTGDGFITGPINGATPAAGAFDAVTIGGGLVTFSGGQQQQGFDGGSYETGPAAYLFVNTGGGDAVFTGASGNTITGGANNGDNNGLISILGGATSVSFFAADRANGQNTTIDIIGVDGTTILADDVVIPSGDVDENFFEFTAENLGGNIGSISFNLPGPNANAPYVVAIDTFSATVVPEPSSALLAGVALGILSLRRRR